MSPVIDVKSLGLVDDACGQAVRELVQIGEHGSIAHVITLRNQETRKHYHTRFTEIYYILQGNGLMILGMDEWHLTKGQLIVVKPQTHHKLRNIGIDEIHYLIFSVPAFDPTDIHFVDEENA